MTKTRPPATTGDDWPSPTFVVHSGFGGLSGQAFGSLAPWAWPSRSRPRHCGQSSARATAGASSSRNAIVRGMSALVALSGAMGDPEAILLAAGRSVTAARPLGVERHLSIPPRDRRRFAVIRLGWEHGSRQ